MALSVVFQNPAASGISGVDITLVVHGQANLSIAKLAVGGAILAPFEQETAVCVKLLDAVVIAVVDVYITFTIRYHAGRVTNLAVATPVSAIGCQQFARFIQLCYQGIA